ncbi:MAG: cytochrome D ubiquinol oxidase subunit II [Candidatus Margulisiibacteriota bacterium]|nr:MAG: hypothetical protein A2X43_06275 [Candidatus Margulisbacteria bacterium GWD2_39_127]OGI05244.1 MAG: hypothetical protein A2X42_02935 [Candidatus Margulisbacteria bacterium GWF2_38_17]OGI06293.1 MAG: hypothetical protein A2X41_08515 [Candidatus Margulisbacteria bacterium GWE2_39_32]PZM78950.1 MAG: cytochrome D ubiquinol oxidase subunit II [Candidatus Margulisiibacteriota bacterium]HAR64332.1 cytochrome D ubiquinol oxidase subunit II [Candidatus Margulisiibacteriota bacterium]
MHDTKPGYQLTDELIGKVKAVVSKLPFHGNHKDVITEMLFSIARTSNLYKLERWELMSIVKAVQELLGAFGMFSIYKGVAKITIFGSARIKKGHEEYELARRFGQLIREAGYYVITGAGPGIMEAGNEGAGRDYSFGLNIMLPFEQSSNPVIEGDLKDYTFRYFFTRKLMFLKESSGIVVCPGGYGTMDELYETLTMIQNGKTAIVPIVLLNCPGSDFWKSWDEFAVKQYVRHNLVSPNDRSLYKILASAEEARDEILNFYKNFHSYRYWKDNILIIRVKKYLNDNQLSFLSSRFKDLTEDKTIHRIKEQPFFDKNNPKMKDMHYLGLQFIQRDYGTLRQMIDCINEF